MLLAVIVIAYLVMVYIAVAYIVMPYVAMPYTAMAYILMADRTHCWAAARVAVGRLVPHLAFGDGLAVGL